MLFLPEAAILIDSLFSSINSRSLYSLPGVPKPTTDTA